MLLLEAVPFLGMHQMQSHRLVVAVTLLLVRRELLPPLVALVAVALGIPVVLALLLEAQEIHLQFHHRKEIMAVLAGVVLRVVAQ
jgi:cadmium resistance protein CadD (predicted permease)